MEFSDSPEVTALQQQLCRLKGEHGTWRDALVWWSQKAPPWNVWSVPLPIYVWMIESGELDSGPADEPADQVYFAVAGGAITIGISPCPADQVAEWGILTRTIFGGVNEESMLHNLFRAYNDFGDLSRSGDWYLPHPLLMGLANAQAMLKTA